MPPKEDVDSHEEAVYWTKIVNELKQLHTLSIKVDNLEAKITQEEKIPVPTPIDMQRVCIYSVRTSIQKDSP